MYILFQVDIQKLLKQNEFLEQTIEVRPIFSLSVFILQIIVNTVNAFLLVFVVPFSLFSM